MCGFTLLRLHSDSIRVHFLWIIHGSPVEGKLNWDVVVLSRVLGGSRALGRKLFVVPNIGAGTREMRAMMVWGLSWCLATAWVRGISLYWRVGLGSCRLCRPRGRRPEMYTGWRTWWPAPVREGLPLCREFTLLCLLLSAWLRPVRHSWCTVYIFEHFVDVSNHLTCLSALDLFGAC